MEFLFKRNRTKPLWSAQFGKSKRFFVLDFQCHRLYYKLDRSSTEIKLICSFNQIVEISFPTPKTDDSNIENKDEKLITNKIKNDKISSN